MFPLSDTYQSLYLSSCVGIEVSSDSYYSPRVSDKQLGRDGDGVIN